MGQNVGFFFKKKTKANFFLVFNHHLKPYFVHLDKLFCAQIFQRVEAATLGVNGRKIDAASPLSYFEKPRFFTHTSCDPKVSVREFKAT